MAEDDFLTSELSCAQTYKTKDYRKPEQGDTLAPWVRIKFLKVGNEITVGNDSFQDDPIGSENTAVIKEFEFGSADGVTITATIHDQKGGSFARFMEDLVKDSKCLSSPSQSITMESQWGWTSTFCAGNAKVKSSPKHYSTPLAVECNFSGGKFMFTIISCDMGNKMLEGRTKASLGTESNPICFTDAITELLTESCGPVVSEVEFLDKDNKPGICWKVKDCGADCPNGKKKGAKSCWNPQNVDKLNYCCTTMLKEANAMTANDRMCYAHYDSTVKGGKIIIQEDVKPEPGKDVNAFESGIGTYIVNGGKFSPVIEFNPRIKWDFLALQNSGGQASNQAPLMNTDGGEAKGDPRSQTLIEPWIPCMGSEISSAADRATEDREGARAEQATNDASTIHEHALNLLHHPIEADLVIQGDPSMARPLDFWQKTIAIVFVNPFHIFPSFAQSEDWLVGQPSCNEVLSNRAWTINHVTHKISPGSYTTTLRLLLAGSGQNIECFDPIGGVGSAGWQPKCCK